MERIILKKGDIIRLEKGTNVSAYIPKKFAYEDLQFSSELVHTSIEIGKVYKNGTEQFDTSFFEGNYVVTEAYLANSRRRTPYRVYCYKKDNPSIKVDFYYDVPYDLSNYK